MPTERRRTFGSVFCRLACAACIVLLIVTISLGIRSIWRSDSLYYDQRLERSGERMHRAFRIESAHGGVSFECVTSAVPISEFTASGRLRPITLPREFRALTQRDDGFLDVSYPRLMPQQGWQFLGF